MWYVVERDGNPKKTGYYWCTMIAEREDGQKVAYADLRNFGDVTNLLDEYRMKDQPLTGLGWSRDSDGLPTEVVYSWSDEVVIGTSDVPEGVLIVKIMHHDND